MYHQGCLYPRGTASSLPRKRFATGRFPRLFWACMRRRAGEPIKLVCYKPGVRCLRVSFSSPTTDCVETVAAAFREVVLRYSSSTGRSVPESAAEATDAPSDRRVSGLVDEGVASVSLVVRATVPTVESIPSEERHVTRNVKS